MLSQYETSFDKIYQNLRKHGQSNESAYRDAKAIVDGVHSTIPFDKTFRTSASRSAFDMSGVADALSSYSPPKGGNGFSTREVRPDGYDYVGSRYGQCSSTHPSGRDEYYVREARPGRQYESERRGEYADFEYVARSSRSKHMPSTWDDYHVREVKPKGSLYRNGDGCVYEERSDDGNDKFERPSRRPGSSPHRSKERFEKKYKRDQPSTRRSRTCGPSTSRPRNEYDGYERPSTPRSRTCGPSSGSGRHYDGHLPKPMPRSKTAHKSSSRTEYWTFGHGGSHASSSRDRDEYARGRSHPTAHTSSKNSSSGYRTRTAAPSPSSSYSHSNTHSSRSSRSSRDTSTDRVGTIPPVNLYVVLKVSPSASSEELKKAHRKLSLQNHPDRGGSTENMAEINRAYDVLKDEKRRMMYDRTGKIFEVED